MKITRASFCKSIYSPAKLPVSKIPEVAFAGRSNVGKSSLINNLLNRKGIAKTSSTPGRTQSINFIEVNESFYFVDLPGYGYAKVPVTVKAQWRDLIEGYLDGRSALRLVVIIVDARRQPGEDEEQFAEWLSARDIPCAAVITKIDKVKRSVRQQSLRQWRSVFQTQQIVLFSALTGEGKDKLWGVLWRHLGLRP